MNVVPLKQSANNIGKWASLPFFQNGQFNDVCKKLANDNKNIFPTSSNIFRAFQLVQPCDVRVVILGQDPYPNPDHAVGLAFGVPIGTDPLPKSLLNIFAKVKDDVGSPAETAPKLEDNCELTGWAGQGVLLLNTVLTVPEGCPNKHKDIGWRPLIEQATRLLAPRSDIVWLSFGAQAKQHLPSNIQNKKMVIPIRHPRIRLPSTCHPFSRTNQLLGTRSIDWRKT